MTAAIVRSTSSMVAADQSGAHEVAILPPHDLDAEAAVLSAVLLDTSALSRIEDFLRPEQFYSEAHRRIYEAACGVKAAGAAVDVTTVGAWLKEHGRIGQIGGAAYLSEILDSTPAPANVRDHATIVFERWRVRTAIQTCDRASAYGYGVADAQAYIDSVATRLLELSRMQPGAKAESNFEVLARLIRQIRDGMSDDAGDRDKRGIQTGIKGFDDLTLGLFAGHKTTIVAPPRVGKTALALQIAINVVKQGIAVGFWSTEMDREEMGIRQISHLARVDSMRIAQSFQRPTLSADEWNRITVALSKWKDFEPSLHIFDDQSPTVDDICAQAKALAERSVATDGKPLGLIVVDYVQRLPAAASVKREGPYAQHKYATEKLKWLARELRVPVLELAQSKNSEVDKGKGARPRPKLGDAAECYQIERSADRVIHLWRPRETDGSKVTAVFVKVRGGKEGEVELDFKGEFSRFEEDPDDYGQGWRGHS